MVYKLKHGYKFDDEELTGQWVECKVVEADEKYLRRWCVEHWDLTYEDLFYDNVTEGAFSKFRFPNGEWYEIIRTNYRINVEFFSENVIRDIVRKYCTHFAVREYFSDILEN